MIEEGRADLAVYFINAREVSYDDMVHRALADERRTHARLLLMKAEVDCGYKDVNGISPLQLAAAQGFEEVIDFILMKKGHHHVFDPNLGQVTEEGRAVMWDAIDWGHAHVVKRLLGAGIPTNIFIHNKTPLTAACHVSSEVVAAVLIDSGPDVNLKDKNGVAPLLEACGNGLEHTVRLLLQEGACVNTRDPFGDTPLHAAVAAMSEPIVRLLLRAGADVGCENSQGATPLLEASKLGEGGKDIVEMLVLRSGPIDYQDDDGKTSLMWATASGCHTGVVILIQAGANVNLHDDHGVTAALEATYNVDLAIIQTLIRAGADADGEKTCRKTPLVEALKTTEESDGIVEMLVSAGVSVNYQDKEGQTPLMHAAVWGNTAFVEILIRAGANVNLQDDYGYTALFYAAEYEESDIIQLLIDAGANADSDS